MEYVIFHIQMLYEKQEIKVNIDILSGSAESLLLPKTSILLDNMYSFAPRLEIRACS